MSQSLTLGGRRYAPAERGGTFAQMRWTLAHATAAGLTDPYPDDPAAAAREVTRRALDYPHLPSLLAGHLVEEGTAWSEPAARETAARFAALEGEDALRLMDAVGEVIAGFFLLAPRSSATSAPASTTGSRPAAAAPAALDFTAAPLTTASSTA